MLPPNTIVIEKDRETAFLHILKNWVCLFVFCGEEMNLHPELI